MEVSWCFGIVGAVVVLLGTLVLTGDQVQSVRRMFTRMSHRYGAIEEGLRILCGDSMEERETKARELKEGERGFEEILKVIAKRRPGTKCTEISGIRCGAVMVVNAGGGSIPYENISLCPKGASPYLLATKEAVEQWLHDARVRSLSCLGFVIVLCGVVLGLVSLVMQAIASGNC